MLIGRCPDHPFPVDQISGWGHNGWLYKVRRLTGEEALAVEVHRT